jgi:hypothetical protein
VGAVAPAAIVAAPLGIAAGIFAVILLLRRARIRAGTIYAAAGIAAWVAVLKSGVDPVVVGLVMGLLTFAYPAARTDLERASDLFRSFREQPTRDSGAGTVLPFLDSRTIYTTLLPEHVWLRAEARAAAIGSRDRWPGRVHWPAARDSRVVREAGLVSGGGCLFGGPTGDGLHGADGRLDVVDVELAE